MATRRTGKSHDKIDPEKHQPLARDRKGTLIGYILRLSFRYDSDVVNTNLLFAIAMLQPFLYNQSPLHRIFFVIFVLDLAIQP